MQIFREELNFTFDDINLFSLLYQYYSPHRVITTKDTITIGNKELKLQVFSVATDDKYIYLGVKNKILVYQECLVIIYLTHGVLEMFPDYQDNLYVIVGAKLMTYNIKFNYPVKRLRITDEDCGHIAISDKRNLYLTHLCNDGYRIKIFNFKTGFIRCNINRFGYGLQYLTSSTDFMILDANFLYYFRDSNLMRFNTDINRYEKLELKSLFKRLEGYNFLRRHAIAISGDEIYYHNNSEISCCKFNEVDTTPILQGFTLISLNHYILCLVNQQDETYEYNVVTKTLFPTDRRIIYKI